ncbi:MAG: GNAT family N-acetyltransferase [Aristaeellaceae bacterium]
MSGIEYRTMRPDDLPAALLLWQGVDGVHLHSNGEESCEALRRYLQRNPGLSHVALCGTAMVGAVLCGHDGRRGYLQHLAVHPDFRRRGIARQLLGRVEQGLSRAGIRKEALFVLCGNTSAQAFYEHMGWQEETVVKIFSRVLPPEGDASAP